MFVPSHTFSPIQAMASDTSASELEACRVRIAQLEMENSTLRKQLDVNHEELEYMRHCRKPRLTIEKIVNNDKMVRK